MNQDLCRGPAVKTLLLFTLPYLLASFLQTFYGMADLLIVGQFCDTASINAVSLGSQLMHMITVMIIGLAVGTTVRTGFLIGRNEKEKINGVIQNTIVLFGILSLVLMALLLAGCHDLVLWLQTPKEAQNACAAYLKICFAGLPLVFAFNALASLFRGLGDSKSPMIFVAVSCLVNIILDLLFVGPLHMGAAGAALATVIAQGVSVAAGLVMLYKKEFGFQIRLFGRNLSFQTMMELVGLGGPIALQDGFIQVSFMVITVIANARGLTNSTAVGISEKVISFLFLVPSAFLASLAAAVAQNQGAGLAARAKTMLFSAMAIACSYGFFCFVFCQFFSGWILSLFTHDSAVIHAGTGYLMAYSLDCIFAACQFCFSGYFAGIEKPVYSFIHNAVSVLFARIPLAWLASIYFPGSLYPMGLAAPAGSLLSCLICAGFYLHLKNKASKSQGGAVLG